MNYIWLASKTCLAAALKKKKKQVPMSV